MRHSAASYDTALSEVSSRRHSSPPSPKSAGSLSKSDATPAYSRYVVAFSSAAKSLFRSRAIVTFALPL